MGDSGSVPLDMKRNNATKGSLTLEAALVVPLFFLTILTLSSLIQFAGVQEKVFHVLQSEGRRIAMEAYRLPAPIPSQQLISLASIDGFQVRELTYLYPDSSRDVEDLIRIGIKYHVPLPMPVKGKDWLQSSETLLLRGWTGRKPGGPALSPDVLEEATESQLVFLFPRRGEKYHAKDCSFVTPYPFETILTRKLMDRFDPCSICFDQEGDLGELVYCFQNSGTVYHLDHCPTIEKHVISMERQEAIEQGYQPCSRCKGGNSN